MPWKERSVRSWKNACVSWPGGWMARPCSAFADPTRSASQHRVAEPTRGLGHGVLEGLGMRIVPSKVRQPAPDVQRF